MVGDLYPAVKSGPPKPNMIIKPFIFAMRYEHGGIIFRSGRDNFRWIGGSDDGGELIRAQVGKPSHKIMCHPKVTTDTFGGCRCSPAASAQVDPVRDCLAALVSAAGLQGF